MTIDPNCSYFFPLTISFFGTTFTLGRYATGCIAERWRGSLVNESSGFVSIRDGLHLGFPGPGGAPLIHNKAGGTVEIGDPFPRANQANATLSLNGATIQNEGDFVIRTGGALTGRGTVLGDLRVAGGYVSPGFSPGTIYIDGDLIVDSGTLQLEIGDRLDVTGQVQFGADALVDLFLDDIPLTMLDLADYFGLSQPIFDAGFTGSNFSVFTTDPTLLGQNVEVMFGGQSVTVAAELGVVPPLFVPEPATGMLVGLAALGLVRRRARSRSKEFVEL